MIPEIHQNLVTDFLQMGKALKETMLGLRQALWQPISGTKRLTKATLIQVSCEEANIEGRRD